MKKVLVVLIFVFVFGFVGALEYNRTAGLGLPEDGFVTRDEALSAINDSMMMVAEMNASGFSVVGVGEDLAEAWVVLQRVDYSEILRNASASAEDRNKAVGVIGLEDWSDFHYGDVFEYTNAVVAEGELAFVAYDSLVEARAAYDEYLEYDDSVDSVLLDEAEVAFYGEQYSEANNLALRAKSDIEADVKRASFFVGVKSSVFGFFRSLWVYVFLALIVATFFFYRWFSKVLLKKRVVVKEKRAEVLSGIIDELRKMDLEKKITGDAYSSKMKEYKGELSEIRKDLAILEKRIPVK